MTDPMTQPSTIAPVSYSPILSARAVAFPEITLPASGAGCG